MKKFTSTLLVLFSCIYVWAQTGSLETSTFNPPNGFVINNLSPGNDDYGNSIAVQSDGKIVVAVVTTQNVFKIVRYNTNGTLDGTFGTGGIVSMHLTGTDECQSYAVGLQSSGKIVVGGYTWTNANKDFALARFNTDGTLDATFGTNGVVITPVSPVTTSFGVDIIRSLVILSNNNIIAAGYAYNGGDDDFAVAKYTANGALDGTFGTNGTVQTDINNEDMLNGVAVTSTGAVVAVGTSNVGSTTGDYTIVRYTSAGVLDNTFNGTGKVTSGIAGNDEGYGVAIQSNDYIVITGKKPAPFNTTDLIVARYKTDGTPDAGFGTNGITTTNYGPGSSYSNDEGHGIAIFNGQIIVAGTTDGSSNGTYDFLLARYNSNGVLDATFGSSGMSTAALSAQGDIGMGIKLYATHIYVTGYADYSTSGTKDFALAAFQNSASASLPLTLTQFYAQKQTSKVLLQWQTSTEENVKQFVIERSNDGKTYTAIGQVAATGNSTTTKNYSYTDQSPYMSANNYYRLSMQDADGNYKYSKVLIVKFTGELSTNVQVFPSPVKDILQIQIPGGLNGNIGLQIIDINGRIVKRNNIASDGNGLNTSFDVSNLPNGIYVLKAQAGNTTVTTRFSKL
jgi:uncharacterized delta-60 repeat protein